MRSCLHQTSRACAAAMLIACSCFSQPNAPPSADIDAAPDPVDAAPDTAATGGPSDGIAEPETQDGAVVDTSRTSVDAGPDDTYDAFSSPSPTKLRLIYGFAPLHVIVTRIQQGVGTPSAACAAGTGTLLDLNNSCWRDNPTPSSGWAKFSEETVEGPEWVALAPLEPGYRYWVWLYAPDVPGAPPLGELDGFYLILYYYGVLTHTISYFPASVPHLLERGEVNLIGVIDAPLESKDIPKLHACSETIAPCAGAASEGQFSCHGACVAPVVGLPGALSVVTCIQQP